MLRETHIFCLKGIWVWIPLILISLFTGNSLSHQVHLSLLRDKKVLARFQSVTLFFVVYLQFYECYLLPFFHFVGPITLQIYPTIYFFLHILCNENDKREFDNKNRHIQRQETVNKSRNWVERAIPAVLCLWIWQFFWPNIMSYLYNQVEYFLIIGIFWCWQSFSIQGNKSGI